MRFYTFSTKVQQSALECETVCFNMEKVKKVLKNIDDDYQLVIFVKFFLYK